MNQISIKNIYRTKFRGDNTKTYQIFGVQLGDAKMTRKVQFYPEATLIKYHQKSSKSCCLSSLASAVHFYGYNRSVYTLAHQIEESLTLQKK